MDLRPSGDCSADMFYIPTSAGYLVCAMLDYNGIDILRVVKTYLYIFWHHFHPPIAGQAVNESADDCRRY